MDKQGIKRALSRQVNGGQFMTATDIARVLNVSDTYKVKRKYLNDLDCLDGKYYLIDDVVAVLNGRVVCNG